METVSVAFCFNNPYCQLASGAISSLINHASDDYQYDIYIVHDDISEHNQFLLSGLNRKANVSIKFISIIFEDLTTEDISYTRHTKYTFARLFFHKIFPEIDKLLYLDSDLIVNSDISELYRQNLEKFPIGGCIDNLCIEGLEELKKHKILPHRTEFVKYGTVYEYFLSYLRLCDNEMLTYFNAGVILLNLKQYGKAIDEKLHDMLKVRYYMPDQDILNIIFKDNKKILEPRFNVFDTRTIKFVNENSKYPVIIHYNGRIKPNDAMNRPAAYRYWEEVAKTSYYYPALERFVNIKIASQPDKINDPHVIENLFFNLKRYGKTHRRRKFIRLIIKMLVDGKKYKKLKRNPERFFADSKNTFIRLLGKFYN